MMGRRPEPPRDPIRRDRPLLGQPEHGFQGLGEAHRVHPPQALDALVDVPCAPEGVAAALRAAVPSLAVLGQVVPLAKAAFPGEVASPHPQAVLCHAGHPLVLN